MRSKIVLGFSVICVLGGVALAQEEHFDPEEVIGNRQAALREIGAAFKGITDELRKSQPMMALIRQYAKQIDDLAKQQHLWFPPGTGPESEIETAAKPEIWQKPAEFKAGQTAMAEQAAKLAQVAAGTDVKAIRAEWQALGRTCKSCHDKFREEED